MKSLKRILLVITLTTIIGYIVQKASAETGTPDLKMPLKLQLAPPVEGWTYRGQFSQDGDGPLGKLKLTARANLTIAKTERWPVQASLYMKFLEASQLGPDGEWMHVAPNELPQPVNLPPVQMDQYGRAPATYNPGQAPLSLIGDLWPLFAKQHATYSGKVRQSRQQVRDFKSEMEWNLRRKGKLKTQVTEPENPPAPLLSVSAGEQITPLSTKVGGMRLIRYSDKERRIEPFGRQKGYTLSLILDLPEPDLTLVSGQVHKAVTNTGQNILPQRQRHIAFPKLSKDKKAVLLDIELSLPDANTKALAEFSGALYGLKSIGTKKIDLGLMDFKLGAKSELQDCSIDSIRVEQWNKEYTYMRLKANLPRRSVKKVRFYRQDGTEIEVSRGGWSSTLDRITRMEFKTKSQFPPKGRIVIEALDNITKHEIPFKLTNISLLGSESQKESQPPDFDQQMDLNRTHRQKLKPPATEPEKPPASIPSPTAREVIKPLGVEVGGVRLVKYSDKKRGIRPLGHQNGYTLSLILELPEPNLIIMDGRVEKAVTDTGQDIIPERRRHTSSHRFSKDNKAVVFDVELSLPDEAAKGLAELSGALRCLKSTGTKKINLGIMDFKDGTKSKVDGFSIRSVGVTDWDKERTEMGLNVSLLRGSVKKVKVYRENGTQVEVHRGSAWSTEDRLLTYGIRTKGEFPPRGSIVFEVLDGITKHKIPFKLTNISLLGQPP
jgi:hypothetical protein